MFSVRGGDVYDGEVQICCIALTVQHSDALVHYTFLSGLTTACHWTFLHVVSGLYCSHESK